MLVKNYIFFIVFLFCGAIDIYGQQQDTIPTIKKSNLDGDVVPIVIDSSSLNPQDTLIHHYVPMGTRMKYEDVLILIRRDQNPVVPTPR